MKQGNLFQTASTMRFSEAMRLGAMMKPQAYRALYDARTGGTCALGAVADALGVLTAQSGYTADKALRIPEAWLALRRVTLCPHCGKHIGYQIDHVIIHLNNDVRWTREQIADWVATLEPADPDVATSLDVDSQRSSVDAVVPGV